jgi:alpha-1,6-mannosyltransferase
MTLRIAQLANFVGPTSDGMRTAIEHVGQVLRRRCRPHPDHTDVGTVVRTKASRSVAATGSSPTSGV